MRIIFVRYGEYDNGHINQSGRETMLSIAHRLESYIANHKVNIVVADVPRAIESADILCKELHLPKAQPFKELFAEEENGRLPDIETAASVVFSAAKQKDTLIVIASREYLELLPKYILNGENSVKTEIKRGEMLIVDYELRNVSYL